LVHTVLAQFPSKSVPVITVGQVREPVQIEDAIATAKNAGGTIVHTLVDWRLRQHLVDVAQQQGVAQIDLVGELLSRLTTLLKCEPLGKPGLYRQLNREYFERITAIEYTLAHDDGLDPAGWAQADVVLTGVSRTGKTPLSIYLSVLGWKVANVPIVLGLPQPQQFADLDPHHVVGLTIDLDRLLALRLQRYQRLGIKAPADYINPEKMQEEIKAATRLFRQHGFAVLNVTNKPIESSADEVIRLVTRLMTHQ
jgi:regulator of PEP synthase PpsR (kinase-PPPase family)